jgi:hypothetical protein
MVAAAGLTSSQTQHRFHLSLYVRDEPPHVIRMLWSEGHHCFVARYQSKVIAC